MLLTSQCSRNARPEEGASWPLRAVEVWQNQKAFAWANGTARRAIGWAGEIGRARKDNRRSLTAEVDVEKNLAICASS